MFNGAVHPFIIASPKIDKQHFFFDSKNRLALAQEIKRQMKWENNSEDIGDMETKKCAAHMKLTKNNFLEDLQEFAAHKGKLGLEDIYMEQFQSCYNHLIGIRNNIGVYLPTFFFFPMHISIKQHALPIFVGSALKLKQELEQLNKDLKAEENVDIEEELTVFLDASDEDMEDFESSFEGVDNFWPCFDYLVLKKLVNRSIKYKMPLFIF